MGGDNSLMTVYAVHIKDCTIHPLSASAFAGLVGIWVKEVAKFQDFPVQIKVKDASLARRRCQFGFCFLWGPPNGAN